MAENDYLLQTLVRIEAKIDALRLENKSDLAAHAAEDAKKFDEIYKAQEDFKAWRAKMVAYGTVFMFVLTFVSQAIASGHLPGVG